MPGISWLCIDELVLRFREITVLEWVYYMKPNPPQWKDPKDIPFTDTLRHKMMRAIASFLGSSSGLGRYHGNGIWPDLPQVFIYYHVLIKFGGPVMD